MQSIVDNGIAKCYFCGATRQLERHHIYGGANRAKSEKYGLTVTLCHTCHNEPPRGVHYNANSMLRLRRAAQARAMQVYGWSTDDFRKIFGKNYI